MKTLEYKGFIGSVDVSLEDGVVFGKILYINGLVTYEAETVPELEKEFQAAVDDYLEFCKEEGVTAHKSFGGKFNVRVSPEIHKKAALLATKQGSNLNAFVAQAIENEIMSYERALSTTYQYMSNYIATNLDIIKDKELLPSKAKLSLLATSSVRQSRFKYVTQKVN